jgi:tetratricopeptide (TPR) repeat protein
MKRIAVTLLAAIALVSFARADQKDPRLDELFKALAETKDERTAEPIEQEIWRIWSEAKSPTTSLLLDRSSTVAEAGDLDTSLTLLNTLVALDPGFAEGWATRATLRVMREEPNEAIKDIERALALEPRHFAALAGLGQIMVALGNNKAALKAFDAALKINPSLADVRAQAEALRRKVGGQKI